MGLALLPSRWKRKLLQLLRLNETKHCIGPLKVFKFMPTMLSNYFSMCLENQTKKILIISELPSKASGKIQCAKANREIDWADRMRPLSMDFEWEGRRVSVICPASV